MQENDRKRSSSRQNLIAVVGSLLVTLLLFLAAEAWVRVTGMEPESWPSVDNIFELENIHVDPLLGPQPQPGWKGEWMGMFETEIDSRGFRSNGAPFPVRAAERVAFVGDSCTFGWGVEDSQTYVARLAEMQRRLGGEPVDFVNAAYPGQSAPGGTYTLSERVLPLQPDVVVIAYSANNAFRFSLVSDTERFRFFGLRKVLLHSRLFHILAAKMARRSVPEHNPRERALVHARPLHELRRVADANEFESAVREMIEEARGGGARPVLLVLPRASAVSTRFTIEDASVVSRRLPPPHPGRRFKPRELAALEVSCLDHLDLADPIATLRERRGKWHRVYPDDPRIRQRLRQGAKAFLRKDSAAARRSFEEALDLEPDVPLSWYLLGVTQLASDPTASPADLSSSDRADGLAALDRADRLACSVFLHYQVLLWKLATELSVPIVDATMPFEAYDKRHLFLDQAHPTPTGHRLIAEELWPTLHELLEAKSQNDSRR